MDISTIFLSLSLTIQLVIGYYLYRVHAITSTTLVGFVTFLEMVEEGEEDAD